MSRTPGMPMKILGLLNGPTVESFIGGEQRGLGPIEEVYDLPENIAQVQVTKYPKIEAVPAQLQAMQPDIVYINPGLTPNAAATPTPAAAATAGEPATTAAVAAPAAKNISSSSSPSSPSSSSPCLATQNLGPLPFLAPLGPMPEATFATIFSATKIKLIYLDAANTFTLGQKLFCLPGVEHVICWAPEAPPKALQSMYFAHVFFSCIENQALIIPEAFAIACHLTKSYCSRVNENGLVTEPNLPRLLSFVPGILPTSASIPPYVQRPENTITPPPPPATAVANTEGGAAAGGGAGDGVGADGAGPSNFHNINTTNLPTNNNNTNGLSPLIDANYAHIRLCSPHAEIRMMITGLYEIINPHCMAYLCESMRAVLVSEVRSLKLIKMDPCTTSPAYLPPGSTAVRCEVRTATGITFTVMIGGPPETLKSHSLVEHALRQTVTSDAQALQLKLPPPGAPLPSIKKHPAVAGGAYCIELMALTSTWAIQVIKSMSRNAQSRSLVSMGVAAVSNYPTLAFSNFDGNRFTAMATGNNPKKLEELLKREEPAMMPGEVPKKARVAPPMPVTAADAAAATAAVFAAAAAAAARNGGGGGGGGGQQGRPGTAPPGGAKTPSLEGVAPRPPSAIVRPPQHPSGAPLPPLPPHPFHAAAAAAIAAAAAAAAKANANANVNAAGKVHRGIPRIVSAPSPSNRPPINMCTEAVFISDLVNFLKTYLRRKIDAANFPEVSLNGSKLDVFTLYREVCRRGGYAAANRIDWKNGVFPWMKNFSEGHKLTAIGNMLKHHYQTLLLEYERNHPGDVQKDGCVSCGDGGAGGDGMCPSCRQGGSGRSSAAGLAAADALMGPGGNEAVPIQID